MKYTKTVRASRNVRPTRPVRASRVALRRPVKADDEIEDIEAPVEDIEAPAEGEPEVSVEPEASELLFEAEDVAELVSEVTGQPVEVTVDDDDSVAFTIGDDTYTVTPEGDEEVVEQSRRITKSASSVRAGRQMVRRPASARRVSASRRVASARRPAPARKVSASRRVSATRRPQK